MARVSTYLNFARSTEAAFLFYKAVFKTEFTDSIKRFKDVPAAPGQPPLSDADKELVMHVELPILGGHVLMGTSRFGRFGGESSRASALSTLATLGCLSAG